jgi:DNA-binding transcriptional LysR family regulator
MPVNLPTNLIRSFVAIVDTGSMLNASNQVYVTQSALSLQIKRLEELVQQSLFLREGRRLELSDAGTILLDYARRLLALHDEALIAVGSGGYVGPIRVGTVQDFADTILSGLLGQFAGLHPDALIYAKVAGTSELQDLLDRDQLDMFIGYAAADDPAALRVTPMAWYGGADLASQETVPLAVLERPCRFREAAIASLEAAGRSYRIAVETPNLSSLRAAVDAHLGVTCRTDRFLDGDAVLDDADLPRLPRVSTIVVRRKGLDQAPAKLAELAIKAVRSLD